MFVLYALALYSLFHHLPGFEGYHSAAAGNGDCDEGIKEKNLEVENGKIANNNNI